MIHRGPFPVPLPERIWPRVVKQEGCWRWLGTHHGAGYAIVSRPGKGGTYMRVHRWMYEQKHGEVPAHLHMDHLCRNRWCVNPDHVEPVTMKENILRGESPAAKNKRKTHCLRGHLFDGIDGSGYRFCKQCRRSYQATYRAKRQAQ